MPVIPNTPLPPSRGEFDLGKFFSGNHLITRRWSD